MATVRPSHLFIRPPFFVFICRVEGTSPHPALPSLCPPPPVLIVFFRHLQQVVSTSVICISRLSIGKSERAAAGASHWATPAAQLTSAPFRNGWHNVNDMLQVSVADCAPLGGSRRLPAAPPAPKRFIKKSRAKKQNIPAGRRHQGSMDFSDEEFTRGNRRNICWFFVCSSGFRCV